MGTYPSSECDVPVPGIPGMGVPVSVSKIFGTGKKYRYRYRLTFWVPSYTGGNVDDNDVVTCRSAIARSAEHSYPRHLFHLHMIDAIEIMKF